MKKLTDRQEEALTAMDGEAHDDQQAPADNRTMKALLGRGLVSWDAISPDTYGGWKITKKGEAVRDSL